MSCDEHLARPAATGNVFWIFGLSGAGKSTVAAALAQGLRDRQIPVLALDGDTLRGGLCNELGFSGEDRTENIRRAAEIAKLGIASGLCVVGAFITPLKVHRELVATIVPKDRVSLVYADASIEVCGLRDVKGLYAARKPASSRTCRGFLRPLSRPSTRIWSSRPVQSQWMNHVHDCSASRCRNWD